MVPPLCSSAVNCEYMLELFSEAVMVLVTAQELFAPQYPSDSSINLGSLSFNLSSRTSFGFLASI